MTKLLLLPFHFILMTEPHFFLPCIRGIMEVCPLDSDFHTMRAEASIPHWSGVWRRLIKSNEIKSQSDKEKLTPQGSDILTKSFIFSF